MRLFWKTTARAAWLCAASWLTGPAAADAQSMPSVAEALEVQPGATCVTAESLAPQVDAWLGDARLEAGVTVRVRGADDDPRDVAFEVRRGGESLATRRFAPAPFVCRQLEATLALAIAMALQASLREQLLHDLGVDETGDEAARPTDADTLSWQVRVGTGLLPRRSFGGGVAFARELGERFALRAELAADGARDNDLGGQGGSFDTWLLSAQIAACALFPLTDDWRARACFGGALGALRASGAGYQDTRGDWLAWVALANGLGLSVRLSGSWWLDVPLTVFVPLNDVGFQVLDERGQPASSRALPVVGLTVGAATAYRF